MRAPTDCNAKQMLFLLDGKGMDGGGLNWREELQNGSFNPDLVSERPSGRVPNISVCL